eukprot:Gb_19846 [translate_table: standard]
MLEIHKFIRKKDGMEVMTRIHKLKQYFSQNPMDKDKKIPMSLANEFWSLQLKDKKRNEGEMIGRNPTTNNSILEGPSAKSLLESEKDDPEGVNCDDGQSVLTVETMAIDPRSVNYDNPFVLTVGTMTIDIKVGDLRILTVGTTPINTNTIDSDISVFDKYGNLVEKGQKIKVELTRLDIPPDHGKEQIIELEPAYLDQFEVFVDEPLNLETEVALCFSNNLMLGTPTAPLRKIILESGLGGAIVGGVKILQRNLFTNDVLYAEILFAMPPLRPNLLPLGAQHFNSKQFLEYSSSTFIALQANHSGGGAWGKGTIAYFKARIGILEGQQGHHSVLKFTISSTLKFRPERSGVKHLEITIALDWVSSYAYTMANSRFISMRNCSANSA